MTWLSPADSVEVPVGLPPVVPPRATRELAAAVRPGDSSEPLEVLPASIDAFIVYDSFPLPKRGAPRLRSSVVRRLAEVRAHLPEHFGLTVLDAYRTLAYQVELIAYYRGEDPDLGSGYVSDPTDASVLPPHTTGGAIDLTLNWKGTPLALGTDFDSFTEDAHPASLEGRDDVEPASRDLRRLLNSAMRAQGFAPHPLEWWHWSYGDQWWAVEYDQPESLYSQRLP